MMNFNPIMPGVHRVVRHMLKILQFLIFNAFNVSLTILRTPGIIGIKTLSSVNSASEFKTYIFAYTLQVYVT